MDQNTEETLKWTPGDVRCLIDQYERNIDRFDSLPEKKVWEEVSVEMRMIRGKPFSGDQCNGKWKGLKSMYKKIKDHNNTSGNSRKNWEYFDSLDRILFRRPEVNAPATCSSSNNAVQVSPNAAIPDDYYFVDIIEESSSQITHQTTVTRKRKADDMEAARAKRHQDKMENTHQFLNLFEKLVNNVIQGS